jgi:polysaccharide export outer membrane protein
MSASSASARIPTTVVAAALLVAAGCRHGAEFMWVEAVPKSMMAGEATYQIAPGDVIGIRVFGQEASSVERVRVRDDGRIALPLLGDVVVAGMEPDDLARRVEVKLKAFITAPVVTIVVHERRPLRVSVVGKVAKPGLYDLDRGAGVIHALAAAGGPTPFADEDGVYVLRSGYWADGDPAPARIRFRYHDLLSGKAPASLFVLHVGDVVVVE